jgi:hypothetical protein
MVGDPDGFALVSFILIRYLSSDAERGSVKGGLWDESIREWNSEKTANKCCKTEKPEIPMEASGLP